MGKVRIDFHYDDFNRVRRSEAVRGELLARGASIAAAAGDGFVVRANDNQSRVRVFVVADTAAARKAAADHALEGALDAGRG